MSTVRPVSFAVVIALLSGCALLTKPSERPVIEEKLNPAWGSPAAVGTLSLTPERRVVLVNFRNNRFCAEAPTEIGADIASVLSAKLSGGQVDKATVDAAINSAIAMQNTVLNKRTQGMQLFLANSYFACQMYMNGGIDERQLLEMQFLTLKIVEPLILAELPYLYQGQKNGTKDDKPASTVVPKSADAIKDDVSKTVTDILNKKSAKPDEAPKQVDVPK